MDQRNRIRQRLLVEELIRKRRSDDAERFVEVFRRSTVDPNPHQIEAAMFALRRLPSGGAVLADEVGLGKTIEAGLVITQLRSEGRGHVLIIVPLSLARQWQVELQELFSLRASVGQVSHGRGIYIVGREFASTPRGRAWLEGMAPWDLIVVDEAHEMFAGIHARFSRHTGTYHENLAKAGAKRAAQVKVLMQGAPVLLLTATPLQNNLLELWALVHYVDPEQQVLGRFNEFCTLFVAGEGGRAVVSGMEDTLRDRLSLVLKRTLRRQAQPFMKQPFRDRHVYTANFNPERLETELYQAVSRWLSQEVIAAYRQGHRGLMALQLRRRMASSTEALLATLGGVRQRMLKMLETGAYPGRDDELEWEDLGDPERLGPVDMNLLEQDLRELERLEAMARDAVEAGTDAKKRKLLEIVRQVEARAIQGVVSDKVVVFTESVKTMESLLEYLEANGFEGQVTTFSGNNDGPIARRALENWQEQFDDAAAVRGALIHEFKTRTRILIATEAGAKGLNLQFCNCLVNYDLPWNPQRIEQRIGRVHRYGQQHDVVIVNFINLSNEAERRVYDLLEQKLNVFRSVLDASDTILNTPEVALNLEARINEMLDRCRTPEQIQEAFDRFNLELDQKQRELRDQRLASARRLMEELDGTVQVRLGQLEGEMAPALSRCDEILLDILQADGDVELLGPQGPRTLFRWHGRLCHLGPPDAECGEPVHLYHPDVQAVIARCIEATDGQELEDDRPYEVYRVRLAGLEEEQRLLVLEPPDDLEVAMGRMKADAERHQREYVDRMIAQIAARRDDLRRCGDAAMTDLHRKLDVAERARRLAASGADMAKAQAQQKKILGEMERLRRETASETERRLAELDEEERRIRLLQFVDATPDLLFRVVSARRAPA
ncbi:MAG: SNF2-related protein [Candidatus Xenobia bacterium]